MKSMLILLTSALFIRADHFAQTVSVDTGMHHLRSTEEREWSSFKTKARKKLELNFEFPGSAEIPHVLQLRQENVRQKWTVTINGRQLGVLKDDEQTFVIYFDIPAGLLKKEGNHLDISQGNSIPDDIRVGEIILHNGTTEDLLSQARIEIMVNEKQTPVPAHITIINNTGALQPVRTDGEANLPVREGCIYTGNGKASFTVPAGDYTIYAGRGFEYSIDSIKIRVDENTRTAKVLQLHREVPTDGWVAVDTHIHTLTHSGHGDASMHERLITIAGEGIEVPVITEHNLVISVDSLADAMGMRRYFTPVTGTELTTRVGHFNLFPLSANTISPDADAKNWNAIAATLDSMQKGVVILNHARDVHYDFRPFGPARHIAVAGLDLENQRFPANAMEIINSSAQLADYSRLMLDWFGMLNRGQYITPIGSSDSHDVGRYLVGQGRTYVRSPDTDPGKININGLQDSLLAGKVMVSFGLMAELNIDTVYGPGSLAPAGKYNHVNVRVLGPAWINAQKVFLYANGKKLKDVSIGNGKGSGIKWAGSWLLPATRQDYYLVAVTDGAAGINPFWPVPLPYQRNSPHFQPRYMGVSGAVWIDADGDGKRSSAFDYAKRIIDAGSGNYTVLLNKLAKYDEAVSIQAAAILYQKDNKLKEPAFLKLLNNAAPHVREGFNTFIAALNTGNRK